MIYFDNSATTKPSDRCIEIMNRVMVDDFANASSLHSAGVRAHKWIDLAKKNIALEIGANTSEILITSGGTYSNNLAVFSAINMLHRRGKKIVVSAVEHPSVSEQMQKYEKEGFEVVYCDPRSVDDFEKAIDDKTILVSCMMVNNETGLILPVEKLKRIIIDKKSPALLHIDAVQAFGKIPVNVKKLQCDFLTISAHKINGPKGVGALYVKRGVRTAPVILGGEQENGIVPGTYNTPAIAGFAQAVSELKEHKYDSLKKLYEHFMNRMSEFDFIKYNSYGNQAYHIINITFEGYLGENVLHFLEGYNIFASQGSACSSHSKQKGKIIQILGADKKTADGSLRISFSHENTIEQIDEFFDVCAKIPVKLIKLYN